jgi:single-stranded-DNA-specific exonuclease
VISFEENIGTGSGRSIQGIHLIEVLDKCADFLHTYGGHRKAAGIQIFKEELEGFKERVNFLIKEGTKAEDFIPVLDIDLKIDFDDINIEFIDELQLLEPFGEENPMPLFVSSSVYKKSSPKKANNGYSLWLSDNKRALEGVIYDKNILEIIEYGNIFEIVYSLEKNKYYNEPRLVIRDVRLAGDEN